jgi:hypothetical protein
MDARYAIRHARALDLAQRAFREGARLSTVELLTGLTRGTLRTFFSFAAAEAPRPGKRPSSPERFVKNAALLTMIDASLVYAIYHDHRRCCDYPADALLAAYRLYTRLRAPARLSFDRVFYIVSWVDRLWDWAGKEPAFRFVTCRVCHCRYLAPFVAVLNDERDCPFCRLMHRYGRSDEFRHRLAGGSQSLHA